MTADATRRGHCTKDKLSTRRGAVQSRRTAGAGIGWLFRRRLKVRLIPEGAPADAFRFAEAMTRNTSQVDVYHLGMFAGLGSRHNVSHWDCGAKEARISEAWLKRFYYYLTADERTGDLLKEVLTVDETVAAIQRLRKELVRRSNGAHSNQP